LLRKKRLRNRNTERKLFVLLSLRNASCEEVEKLRDESKLFVSGRLAQMAAKKRKAAKRPAKKAAKRRPAKRKAAKRPAKKAAKRPAKRKAAKKRRR
jgi:hypothetical protein